MNKCKQNNTFLNSYEKVSSMFRMFSILYSRAQHNQIIFNRDCSTLFGDLSLVLHIVFKTLQSALVDRPFQFKPYIFSKVQAWRLKMASAKQTIVDFKKLLLLSYSRNQCVAERSTWVFWQGTRILAKMLHDIAGVHDYIDLTNSPRNSISIKSYIQQHISP